MLRCLLSSNQRCHPSSKQSPRNQCERRSKWEREKQSHMRQHANSFPRFESPNLHERFPLRLYAAPFPWTLAHQKLGIYTSGYNSCISRSARTIQDRQIPTLHRSLRDVHHRCQRAAVRSTISLMARVLKVCQQSSDRCRVLFIGSIRLRLASTGLNAFLMVRDVFEVSE